MEPGGGLGSPGEGERGAGRLETAGCPPGTRPLSRQCSQDMYREPVERVFLSCPAFRAGRLVTVTEGEGRREAAGEWCMETGGGCKARRELVTRRFWAGMAKYRCSENSSSATRHVLAAPCLPSLPNWGGGMRWEYKMKAIKRSDACAFSRKNEFKKKHRELRIVIAMYG